MPGIASLDQDLVNTLSPEEQAAINEADPDEIAALQRVAGEGGTAAATADADDGGTADDDDDGEGGDDAAGAAEDTAAAAAPAADAAAAPAAPGAPTPPAADASAGAAADDDEGAPRAVYTFQKPADFDERVSALKAAEQALFERHRQGEISSEELQAELGRHNDERETLSRIQTKAELSAELQAQADQEAVNRAVAKVFAAAASVGIDYKADEAKRGDLDAFVKTLARNPANNDKSLQWFFNEAHLRVMALHGIAAAAPTPPAASGKPAAPAADPKAKAAADRRVDLDALPKTLSQVPGGQGAGDIGGEFDDIMALDGDAYEQAIEQMARRQPERFARFQAQQQ